MNRLEDVVQRPGQAEADIDVRAVAENDCEVLGRGRRRRLAPPFSTDNSVVAASPVRLTATLSVVPMPAPSLNSPTFVLLLSAVKAETSIVLARSPVSSAFSNPEIVSTSPSLVTS